MSKVQVLVTTMHQTDFTKFYEMNLNTDAVIANQADSNCFEEQSINECRAKLITTDTRGLSINRNVAIDYISDNAEYIVFADDDLRFYDNYEQVILEGFEKSPDADAIKFNLNCISERKISMNPIKETHKTSRREVTSWGVCGVAVRTDIIKKHKLRFNERFGTGTENYCGEDTIFLQELFKKRIKLYASPEYIADIDQSESSWNEGYTVKRFTVNGMILSEIYPKFCYPLIIRSAYKFSKRGSCKLPFFEILRCYYKGIKKNEAEHKLPKGSCIKQ